jgi:hypothetical protein
MKVFHSEKYILLPKKKGLYKPLFHLISEFRNLL